MRIVVKDAIARPAAELYQAIVQVEGLNKFFTTGSSGPLVEGETVTWVFGGEVSMEIKVGRMVPDRLISWEWPPTGPTSSVTIELEPIDGGTRITATEGDFAPDADGLARAVGQTQGWTYFATTLRAWLIDGVAHAGLNPEISATAR